MKRLVTAAQMAAIEKASAQHGVATWELMLRAGTELAKNARKLIGEKGRYVILCGRGNNGGDGLVAASWLFDQDDGHEVYCELLGGEDAGMPAEAQEALKTASFDPAPIPSDYEARGGDVVIDALLGTGVSRAPSGPYAEAIARIAGWRARGARVVSADIPSGVPADGAAAFEPCVEADLTVTFGFKKLALAQAAGAEKAGLVVEAEIGLPDESIAQIDGPAAYELEETDAASKLPRRRADTHKGTFGHVLVIAGSHGRSGAAALTAGAALRSGAGLVTVASPSDAIDAILAHAAELMGDVLPAGSLAASALPLLLESATGKDVLVIGPGIARGDDTGELIFRLLESLTVPVVLDADALNAVTAESDRWAKAKAPRVLTPHPGELARLLSSTTAEVQKDRLAAARACAAKTNGVVVLKGARTVIADPSGAVWICPAGNPGMATAGAGDVLAGVIGALLGQGLTPLDAACTGVFAHALAGDRVAKHTGQLGLTASDICDGLKEIWVRWGR